MSAPYVDALQQFDAAKQSISKRFYVKALAAHVDARKKAQSHSQWHAAAFRMLQHHPTAAAAIVKREPLLMQDPALDWLLGTVGIEELFNAMMDLKLHPQLLRVAEDLIAVMPHFTQWIYVTLLSRAPCDPAMADHSCWCTVGSKNWPTPIRNFMQHCCLPKLQMPLLVRHHTTL